MDCKNARLVLAVAHPLASELDARDKAELAGHLADCPDCGPWAEAERRFDECFGKAMQTVPVPAGLAQRIQRRLNADRDAWVRGWAVRAAGVAAGLLLATWLGWALWLNNKPAPNLARLSEVVNVELTTVEQVQQAFADNYGIAMTAPPDFDYKFLRLHKIVDFQGKQVPLLLFCVPGIAAQQPVADVAEVYVLSDQQFDVERAKKETVPPGSHKSITIRSHPLNPHVLYLIVHPTKRRVDFFFKDAKANA